MLIQLKNLVIVNPDYAIFVPKRDSDGNVTGYEITTPEMRAITDITPEECETVFHLAAVPPEADARPLRTREWGVVDGRLNYRYAEVLRNETGAPDYCGLVELLKARAARAAENDCPAEARHDFILSLEKLARDMEFYDFTPEGRDILRKVNLNNDWDQERAKSIHKQWDDIFVNLPF